MYIGPCALHPTPPKATLYIHNSLLASFPDHSQIRELRRGDEVNYLLGPARAIILLSRVYSLLIL
jgi:hypothetical protein